MYIYWKHFVFSSDSQNFSIRISLCHLLSMLLGHYNMEYFAHMLLKRIIFLASQGGWLSTDAQNKVCAGEQNITRSVFMLCSAAHCISDNQLMFTWLALFVEGRNDTGLMCRHKKLFRMKSCTISSTFFTESLFLSIAVNFKQWAYRPSHIINLPHFMQM